MIRYLALQSWAGLLYHPVEVVGETPKRVRVRVLERDGVRMPGGRFARFGDIVLVPKYALREAAHGGNCGPEQSR